MGVGESAPRWGVHPGAVRHAIESDRFRSTPPRCASIVDKYLGFIQQTLEQYPRLRATRVYAMIRDRGYTGSASPSPALRRSPPSASTRAIPPVADLPR